MTTQSNFAPGGKPQPAPSAYVIPLSATRFIFRSQYFNPIKNADVALPPHAFVLFDVSPARTAPVFGEPSQQDGTSWLLFEDDLRVDTPSSAWALSFRPLFKQADGSFKPDAATQKLAEVFIDLERNAWVSPAEVGFIDNRRLLRLPLWPSFLKTKQGGFKMSPPGTQFANTGLLQADNNELKIFGSPGEPWLMQVDQGLYRSFVRFYYYNLKTKQREPIPRGVLVAALGTRALSIGPVPGDPRGRVAAGTAFDDNGTVYLLHERTKHGSAGVHYYVATGVRSGTLHGIIDFSVAAPGAGQPDARLQVVSGDANPRPDARYVLPTEWHSHGMQAWLDEDGNGVPKRKLFKDVRLSDTSASKPLCFHFDDAVLAKGPAELLKLPANGRIAVFDHLLHLRDPDPTQPHHWKTTLKVNYLLAEDAVYVNQQGVDRLSRLAYVDGVFFHLLDARLGVTAPENLGRIASVGARAFIANAIDPRHKQISYMSGNPTMPDSGMKSRTGTGRSEFLLIDASYVDHNFPTAAGGTQALKLMHLLVHVPLKIDGSSVSKAAINTMLPALTHAAERWDQTHPGHPGAPAANTIPRTFGLLPVGGAGAGDKVVLVRHYFGEGPSHPDTITLHVKNSGDLGFADPKNKELTVFVGDIDVRGGGNSESPAQPFNTTRITLAHELGHIMGLPDEYPETLEGTFTQWSPYAVDGVPGRPYCLDLAAMMRGNNQPRLRHFWNYHNRLRAEPEFKKLLDNKDYVVVDPGVSGGLDSELPFVSEQLIADESNRGPYFPIGGDTFVDQATRRAGLILYRLPKDEGTVNKIFLGSGGTPGPLSAADRFDGLALVYIRFMFDFDPKLDNAAQRRKTFSAIEQFATLDLTNDLTVFSTRFQIAAVPPPGGGKQPIFLSRIAIGIVTQFDFVSRHTAAKPPTPVPTGEHVFVRVVPKRAGPNPLLATNPGTPLELEPSEIGAPLLCHALASPTTTGTGSTLTLKTALSFSDFSSVARTVGQLLCDPSPIQRVVRPL